MAEEADHEHDFSSASAGASLRYLLSPPQILQLPILYLGIGKTLL
jgi:hypothetical protein